MTTSVSDPFLAVSSNVTQLNNYFQNQGWDTAAISYEESSEGASDKAIWTVRCKINSQLRGTGVDRTKAGAKDAAARQALSVSSAKSVVDVASLTGA